MNSEKRGGNSYNIYLFLFVCCCYYGNLHLQLNYAFAVRLALIRIKYKILKINNVYLYSTKIFIVFHLSLIEQNRKKWSAFKII